MLATASPPTSRWSSSRRRSKVHAGAAAARRAPRVAAGERFVVAAMASTVRGDGKSGGTLRAATLVATGQPASCSSAWSIPRPATARRARRLHRRFRRAGLSRTAAGARRDRRGELVDRPDSDAGCGGLTGVTPLELYRDWIVEQARRWARRFRPEASGLCGWSLVIARRSAAPPRVFRCQLVDIADLDVGRASTPGHSVLAPRNQRRRAQQPCGMERVAWDEQLHALAARRSGPTTTRSVAAAAMQKQNLERVAEIVMVELIVTDTVKPHWCGRRAP